MEWLQGGVGGGLIGAVVGVFMSYLFIRGRYSTIKRQEAQDTAAAEIDAAKAKDESDKTRDQMYRRVMERYELAMAKMEERHARQLLDQSEEFVRRTRDINEQLKIHGDALKLLHLENLECQRRATKMQLALEASEAKIEALKATMNVGFKVEEASQKADEAKRVAEEAAAAERRHHLAQAAQIEVNRRQLEELKIKPVEG